MALLYFDYDIATIQSRMLLLFPVEMRLKVKTESIIVVLSMMLQFWFSVFENRIDFRKSKAIPKKDGLSDIFQSGLSNEELYSKVSQLIISNNISRVIGIEKPSPNSKINLNCITFNNRRIYLNFDKLSFMNETILIKGAWSFLVWRNLLLKKDTWDGSWN
jgi:alanine racemase